jgi:hypothetical protein
MARTPVTVVEMVPNAQIADPAGTNVDPANGHIVTMPLGGIEELYLEINSTFAGAKTFTIKAGKNPPALAAGQGDLVVTLNAQVGIVGPLTSMRFAQQDSSIWIDVAAAATGTIKAIHMPRTA